MKDNSKIKIILGFAAIYLIWGSTYLAIKFGVESIPPFMLVGIRFIFGGLIFFGWSALNKAPKPKPRHWLTTAIVGVLLLVGGTGLVSWAELTVPSGLTALLIAMVPLWIVLIDWLRPGGQKPRIIVVLGLLLGFLGVGALINPTEIGGFAEIDHFGAFLLILAAFFWAAGSIYSRYADMPQSKIVSSAMQMVIGGLVLIILSLFTGELDGFDISLVSKVAVWSLIYLIIFGSIGFGAYIWLIKESTPSKVATYAYVNPVIALFLGNILAGEAISYWTVSCSVVILISVIIIITVKNKTSDTELETHHAQDSCVDINIRRGA